MFSDEDLTNFLSEIATNTNDSDQLSMLPSSAVSPPLPSSTFSAQPLLPSTLSPSHPSNEKDQQSNKNDESLDEDTSFSENESIRTFTIAMPVMDWKSLHKLYEEPTTHKFGILNGDFIQYFERCLRQQNEDCKTLKLQARQTRIYPLVILFICFLI